MMPPTPPSSSSVAGLLGFGARVRIAPGELQGAAAVPLPPSPRSPQSPRPGSLLNPRVVGPPSPVLTPPSPVVAVGPAPPSPAASEARGTPQPPEERSAPKMLLRPSLAVLQQGHSFADHEDYSRRIVGHMESGLTADTLDEEADAENNGGPRAY
ncbi:hypothetical protein FB451DRAFT_1280504 [Mycena latifolia]|nr:hypothetical protein FB451DRAFT_1280504 [Mycena latifolia]